MGGVLDKFRLDGRVALVTGAARGLGQGMATGLAEAGADIMAVDVINCRETQSRIVGSGGKCESLQIDLTERVQKM